MKAPIPPMITARFTVTKDELAEGLGVSRHLLLTPTQRRIIKGWSIWRDFLSGMAPLLLFWAISIIATGQTTLAPWLIAIGVTATFANMQYYRVLVAWMAANATSAPVETELTASESGVALRAPAETRHLEWPATQGIIKGKTAIFLNVSGAVYPLPLRALENPDATFAQLTAWRGT